MTSQPIATDNNIAEHPHRWFTLAGVGFAPLGAVLMFKFMPSQEEAPDAAANQPDSGLPAPE